MSRSFNLLLELCYLRVLFKDGVVLLFELLAEFADLGLKPGLKFIALVRSFSLLRLDFRHELLFASLKSLVSVLQERDLLFKQGFLFVEFALSGNLSSLHFFLIVLRCLHALVHLIDDSLSLLLEKSLAIIGFQLKALFVLLKLGEGFSCRLFTGIKLCLFDLNSTQLGLESLVLLALVFFDFRELRLQLFLCLLSDLVLEVEFVGDTAEEEVASLGKLAVAELLGDDLPVWSSRALLQEESHELFDVPTELIKPFVLLVAELHGYPFVVGLQESLALLLGLLVVFRGVEFISG